MIGAPVPFGAVGSPPPAPSDEELSLEAPKPQSQRRAKVRHQTFKVGLRGAHEAGFESLEVLRY